MNGFELTEQKIDQLVELALRARERAYVPYSHFRVGACLMSNAGYTPTNCAERTAIFKAVYEGERQFSAIAVASDSENFTAPCGVCRQVLAEFCDAEMPVICINREGKYRILSLGELLPFAFSKKDME